MKQISFYLRPLQRMVFVSLVLMLICGFIFPLALAELGKVAFPWQASGSPVELDGTVVGMAHVGQAFTQPCFLRGRPSAVNYNTFRVNDRGEHVNADGSVFSGPASGSANYAPSNPALVERVKADIEAFLQAHPGVKTEDIPTDLLTASGSGLDPHLSPASALIQLPAVSKASGIDIDTLKRFIEENTCRPMLGIFGEPTVNVLGVNVAIAKTMKARAVK